MQTSIGMPERWQRRFGQQALHYEAVAYKLLRTFLPCPCLNVHRFPSRLTETDQCVRLPKPRRTCIMAVRMASLVGFASRTSSQRTRDSSTFCDRTSASALSA